MYGGDSFSQPTTTAPPKRSKGPNQTLAHFFIRQLKVIFDNQERGEYLFFGRPVDLVCICGRLMEIEKTSTSFKYFVEDNTGAVECVFFLTSHETNEVMKELKVGMVVKLFGKLKKSPIDEQQMLLSGHVIRKVVEFHEVLFHRLTCIRDAAIYEQISKGQSLAVTLGNPGRELATSLAGQSDFGDSFANQSVSNAAGGFNFDTALKNKVMTLINACTDSFGMKKEALEKALPQSNRKELADTLQFLADEGHVYTTVTDNQFQVTGK